MGKLYTLNVFDAATINGEITDVRHFFTGVAALHPGLCQRLLQSRKARTVLLGAASGDTDVMLEARVCPGVDLHVARDDPGR